MTTGRTPPPLREFIFPSTGRSIKLRPVSPLLRPDLAKKIKKTFPEPEPPVETIRYGDKEIAEPNYSHPAYVARRARWLAEFNTRLGEAIFQAICRRAVVIDWDETLHAEVAAVEAQLAEDGIDPACNDAEYLYVAYVCMGSDDEYTLLSDAVFRASAPTEEAIQEAVDMFRGDVSG